MGGESLGVGLRRMAGDWVIGPWAMADRVGGWMTGWMDGHEIDEFMHTYVSGCQMRMRMGRVRERQEELRWTWVAGEVATANQKKLQMKMKSCLRGLLYSRR